MPPQKRTPTIMHYTIEKIATLIGAQIQGAPLNNDVIDWLLTDSRSLAFPESSLFFALRTPTGDGHKYIPDLYRRGMRHFVVETTSTVELLPGMSLLKVKSPLLALQRLAERHREEFPVPVIGITGSNGKTWVKEWLYQLLSPGCKVTRSPKSYNSQIGVPISVCLLSERTEIAIFEAGISKPGEMDALRNIIQPTIGIMTNLGSAHQENFTSMEEKCREKIKLFREADTIIYNADDELIDKEMKSAGLRGTLFSWSRKDKGAHIYIKGVRTHNTSACIDYIYKGVGSTIEIPSASDAAVQDAIHALATLLCLGLAPSLIAERFKALEPVAMRLEVRSGRNALTLINDTYNSDINSLHIALDFADRRAVAPYVLILSDIKESGMSPSELYGIVAQMIEKRRVGMFIGIGPEISKIAPLLERLKLETHFFAQTADFLASPLCQNLHDTLVLIKGARAFQFERIYDTLSQKVHETTLEVNLESIAANLNYYRSFLKPQTKMVCMIKASAYGTGAVEVARTLQDRGVEYLAVAVADEGAELRKAGITADIIVMNPEMSSFQTLFAYSLQPEVYSFELLEALIHAARAYGITDFPIHIKLDTGMRRLGFNPREDIPTLIDKLHHQAALIPRSIFSHFAGSDSPDFDNFTAEQFSLFDQASQQLCQAFPHKILRHICNSAGIERFPQYHLDMVRLGLGLYGVSPITGEIINNVSSLKTTILQIRNVQEGTSIGYSRRTVVSRPSRIAAIPIGYADGLNRHLGNRRGYCLVAGMPAPYVGNICMDVCMIDVTDIPCQAGDEVEIFGENLPVTTLSKQLDTIPYEILTGVSERVKRVYYQ